MNYPTSVTDLANRSLPTDSQPRLARTDSDGLTHEARTHLEMNLATNASHASVHHNFPGCDDVPHVYVVYWPDLGVIKVGLSARARWEWWLRRGAVTIAVKATCCEDHCRKLERWLLGMLKPWGARAFTSQAAASMALGKDSYLRAGFHHAGYTKSGLRCLQLDPPDMPEPRAATNAQLVLVGGVSVVSQESA